jgi:hypothetical protein
VQQAVLDEGGDPLEHRPRPITWSLTDGLDGLEGATTHKDRQSAEESLLLLSE